MVKLSAEAVPIMKEGINLVLSRWSALQMAVVNEWGGRDSLRKSEQLALDIFSWFAQSKDPRNIEELEDLDGLLNEAMISLNTIIDDGSVEEVADKLVTMHEECLQCNYQSIQLLREAPRTSAVSHIRQDNDDDDSDSDEEGLEDDENDDSMNMDVDEAGLKSVEKTNEPRPPKNIFDADGWTTIPSRKSKGERK